jgi:hypothetical protein
MTNWLELVKCEQSIISTIGNEIQKQKQSHQELDNKYQDLENQHQKSISQLIKKSENNNEQSISY